MIDPSVSANDWGIVPGAVTVTESLPAGPPITFSAIGASGRVIERSTVTECWPEDADRSIVRPLMCCSATFDPISASASTISFVPSGANCGVSARVSAPLGPTIVR